MKKSFSRRETVMLFIMLAACVGTALVDLSPAKNPEPGAKFPARVLSVDDSGLETFGLIRRGTQKLRLQILSGHRKGQIFDAVNELRAQLDLDKVFKVGDTVLAGILDNARPGVDTIVAQDHYRINYTYLLFGLFALLLLLFGGITGFNALLSFVFSCLVIWKLVIPLCLKGYSPIGICFAAVMLLSLVIIFLVAGLNRKGLAAFSGTLLGVLSCTLTGWLFTGLFNINPSVMPYSQALLYSGYEFLDMSAIFVGAVFLSSSGAVMDLAMDIAAGQSEVVRQSPAVSRWELLKSGWNIGRSVVGTMTTTLLLAYSGGYLTLMLTFAAQGTSPVDFINNPHVASEVVKTLVGSFSLVLVAPFTAICGAMLLTGKRERK